MERRRLWGLDVVLAGVEVVAVLTASGMHRSAAAAVQPGSPD